jgi:hypothetical protein
LFRRFGTIKNNQPLRGIGNIMYFNYSNSLITLPSLQLLPNRTILFLCEALSALSLFRLSGTKINILLLCDLCVSAVNQYVCVSPRLSAVKFLLFVPFVVKILEDYKIMNLAKT